MSMTPRCRVILLIGACHTIIANVKSSNLIRGLVAKEK